MVLLYGFCRGGGFNFTLGSDFIVIGYLSTLGSDWVLVSILGLVTVVNMFSTRFSSSWRFVSSWASGVLFFGFVGR